nr:hypothetical_protein [Oryza glaberrima]
MASSFPLSSATEAADEAKAHKKIYDQLRQVAETFPTAPSGIDVPYSRHPDGWYMTTGGCAMVIKSHLTARATDIFLVTFPKSGTTWIKALLYSALHRRADKLVAHSPHQLVPFLESQVFVKDQIPDLSSLPEPQLLMTHIPSQSLPDSVAASGCKVVYLCRDPWIASSRSGTSGTSSGHGILMRHTGNSVMVSRCLGLTGSTSSSYWNWHVERPSEVLFLTYEELAADTLGHLRCLAEFVGRPFTMEEQDAGVDRKIVEICAMESLSGLEVNRSGMTNFTEKDVPNNIFFRRGVVGDWRNHLTPEMARRIDEITEIKFKGSGLRLHPQFLQAKRELNKL